jgi:hypothetical protein
LTHYWPFINSTMRDVVGSAHMTQGSNTTFTSDRFGNPNSALALNTGYTIVPSGVYFNTPSFTISVWVYPNAVVGIWSRVIDFTNGPATKTISFCVSSSTYLKPALGIWDTSSYHVGDFISNTAVINNQWQFLVTTFDGTIAKIYIDGTLTRSSTVALYSLPTVTRTQNWIGKGAWSNHGYSSSILDDLRFFNKSLSQYEILELMNSQTTTTTTTTTAVSSTITSTIATSKSTIATTETTSEMTTTTHSSRSSTTTSIESSFSYGTCLNFIF